jgi:hypothetical protein
VRRRIRPVLRSGGGPRTPSHRWSHRGKSAASRGMHEVCHCPMCMDLRGASGSGTRNSEVRHEAKHRARGRQCGGMCREPPTLNILDLLEGASRGQLNVPCVTCWHPAQQNRLMVMIIGPRLVRHHLPGFKFRAGRRGGMYLHAASWFLGLNHRRCRRARLREGASWHCHRCHWRGGELIRRRRWWTWKGHGGSSRLRR